MVSNPPRFFSLPFPFFFLLLNYGKSILQASFFLSILSEGRLAIVEEADDSEVAFDLPGRSSENEFFVSVASKPSPLTFSSSPSFAPPWVSSVTRQLGKKLLERRKVKSCFLLNLNHTKEEKKPTFYTKKYGCSAPQARLGQLWQHRAPRLP